MKKMNNIIQIYFKWALFRKCSIWKEYPYGAGQYIKKEGYYTAKYLFGYSPHIVYRTDRLDYSMIAKEFVTFKYKDLLLIVKFKISLGEWFKRDLRSNKAVEAIWNYKSDPKDEKFWVINAGGTNLAIKAADWTTEM